MLIQKWTTTLPTCKSTYHISNTMHGCPTWLAIGKHLVGTLWCLAASTEPVFWFQEGATHFVSRYCSETIAACFRQRQRKALGCSTDGLLITICFLKQNLKVSSTTRHWVNNLPDLGEKAYYWPSTNWSKQWLASPPLSKVVLSILSSAVSVYSQTDRGQSTTSSDWSLRPTSVVSSKSTLLLSAATVPIDFLARIQLTLGHCHLRDRFRPVPVSANSD